MRYQVIRDHPIIGKYPEWVKPGARYTDAHDHPNYGEYTIDAITESYVIVTGPNGKKHDLFAVNFMFTARSSTRYTPVEDGEKIARLLDTLAGMVGDGDLDGYPAARRATIDRLLAVGVDLDRFAWLTTHYRNDTGPLD